MELIIVAITFILVLGKSVEIFASHDIATSTFKAICHSQCSFIFTCFSFFLYFLHLFLDEHAFFFFTNYRKTEINKIYVSILT